jgi:hypothetical protein
MPLESFRVLGVTDVIERVYGESNHDDKRRNR